MTILGQELAANHSALGRFLVAIFEICRSGGGVLARILRNRRGRATLDELPDYLLRDIGIEGAEIRLAIRLGRQDRHRERT
ncbi:DUF1127 domain-containing protein [Mesorhizobium sp. WSM4887]|uniref:DUF1127 domain-containing protein n=1 Tax=Mesorhizobium sp. WSM4887 TaxID=3038543 RepID=UPI0024166A6A|nr:DUF1127 domain-containing protein [Mesorhizobium sp. WSM4887]MDG4890290.1 DUF1127 domain-containing protein [Mesorhizobium sp. WSM4887]